MSTIAGPSRSPTTRTGSGTGIDGGGGGSLWTEILGSADRQKGLGRKNVVLLSERHHGRTHLLSQLSQVNNKRRKGPNDRATARAQGLRKGLALGYEVVDINEGDEDSIPPLSIFYPPSSHPSLLRLVPTALPPKSLSDTAVVIVLDWTKPSSMVGELVTWLSWVDEWAAQAAQPGETDDLRERLQSHIQHYVEPSSTSTAGMSTAYTGVGAVLPLGQGTLTLNRSGVPIIVVCTKADLMDSVGDEIGMKGGGWEERTDWVQQVLRTICLAHGASLFYTASTQPTTYTLLRTYLLHRLYTPPPSSDPSAHAAITRFPFPHRANVLDRDAVMVPAGWDSWGKINVLREGFDPSRVGKAWEVSLGRKNGGDDAEDGEEGLEDLWVGMIPDTERGPKPTNLSGTITTTEPEQSFLSRQLDVLTKDPNRDPRQSFRHAAATVVGPMGGSEGLNLPGVEKVMKEMEGAEKGEELKEKFARLSRRESTRGTTGPLSPTTPAPSGSSAAPAMPNEALHNFFQGLLANRGKTASTPTATATKTSSTNPAETK
nr:uncharacterized protein CI109_002447 [Kwoniella shandongensis]KAA5529106.1 hypothetical protein CI109_002447 [Kwoniella shandongensis]